MTFLALFGESFIFSYGISRFIILIVAFLGLLVLSVFDIFWNMMNSKIESRYPYKILVLYSNQDLLDQFVEEFEDYSIYDIRAVEIDQFDATKNRDKLDIVALV